MVRCRVPEIQVYFHRNGETLDRLRLPVLSQARCRQCGVHSVRSAEHSFLIVRSGDYSELPALTARASTREVHIGALRGLVVGERPFLVRVGGHAFDAFG